MKTDNSTARYASHMPLDAIGAAGQECIGAAHVMLIGLGGLGCAAAQYLVSSGIGRLTLCDFDTIAASNLARQILFHAEDLGELKVKAGGRALHALNPVVELETLSLRMSDESMREHFPGCDLVIDASDNYGTRLAVNRNCRALGIPWVMASCVRLEGQLMMLRPDLDGQACYRCAYGQAPDTLEDCPGAGIFAPVAGIVGAAAAHFALSHVAGLEMPAGLHLFDGRHWAWRSLGIPRDPDCRECAGKDLTR